MKKQNMQNVAYATPTMAVVEADILDAILSDSYYAGGGGSYGEDDIVDNGNY